MFSTILDEGTILDAGTILDSGPILPTLRVDGGGRRLTTKACSTGLFNEVPLPGITFKDG
jgi:hypothetical protein